MAGRPLRPATDHRLGRPLPHQPANRPQDPPRAPIRAFLTAPTAQPAYAELPHVSAGYSPPKGRFPTCYAPVRHGAGVPPSPSDLHALGTPPALILSQDQTRHHLPHATCRAPPGTTSTSAMLITPEPAPRASALLHLRHQLTPGHPPRVPHDQLASLLRCACRHHHSNGAATLPC